MPTTFASDTVVSFRLNPDDTGISPLARSLAERAIAAAGSIEPVTPVVEVEPSIESVMATAMAATGGDEDAFAALYGWADDVVGFAAGGAADLPFADRDATWDGSAAAQAVAVWASDGSGDTETVDWDKYGQAFFWHADSPSAFGDFKLPFATVDDGKLTAVPKGIFAVAGSLTGARGGAKLPSGDVTAIKDRVSAYYGRMADAFDDKSIRPPFDVDGEPFGGKPSKGTKKDRRLEGNGMDADPTTAAKGGKKKGVEHENVAEGDLTASVDDAVVADPHDVVDANVNDIADGDPITAAGDDAVGADDATVAAAAADTTLQVMIDPANPGRFRSVLAVEEERTADNRIIAKNATSWRETPLPLMLMTTTAPGHDGAQVAGVIENITRKGRAIVGEGRFDTGDAGIEAARLVANRILNAVSIDGGNVEAELQVEEEDPETGVPTKAVQRFTAIQIMGATCVPFPAIGSAAIQWIRPDTDAATAEADMDTFVAAVLADPAGVGFAAADCDECPDSVTAAAPIVYPSEFFADPAFDAPTPVRVMPDGRVSGHLALWGTCHIGLPGCVTPPHSRTNYSHFRTGSLPTTDGEWVPVGRITIDAMHADHKLSARDAAQHYDHTGTAVAFVASGEDTHGIWVSGVLRPGASDTQATNLCGASLSGDWRRIGGNLELIAALAVNVPGYPIAHLRGDKTESLVASGYGPTKATMSHQQATIAAVEARSAERIATLEAALADVNETVSVLASLVAPSVRERLAARFATTGTEPEPEPLTAADVFARIRTHLGDAATK